MHTETSSASRVQLEAALTGILALLLADREERRGGECRRAETILAHAGLSDGQVAAIIGTDAAQVHAILDHDTTVVRPSWVDSVIDRARAHLTDREVQVDRTGGS